MGVESHMLVWGWYHLGLDHVVFGQSNRPQLEDLWELGLTQCVVHSILLALGSRSAGARTQSAGVGHSQPCSRHTQ